MSALSFTANQLLGRRPAERQRHQGETSLAGQMRAALERQGPLTAAELAPVAGVSTALVGALLKHDLHIGRVRFRNGRYEIHDVNPKLEAAIALVRSAGYMVTRGDAA